MKYYIVWFKLPNKYFRSKRLLVYHKEAAAWFSSAEYARKAVKSSRFAHMDYEIIEMCSTSSMNILR